MTRPIAPKVEISATYRGVRKRFLTLNAAWKDIAREQMKEGHENCGDEHDGYAKCYCDWCVYRRGDAPNAWRDRVRQLKAAALGATL